MLVRFHSFFLSLFSFTFYTLFRFRGRCARLFFFVFCQSNTITTMKTCASTKRTIILFAFNLWSFLFAHVKYFIRRLLARFLSFAFNLFSWRIDYIRCMGRRTVCVRIDHGLYIAAVDVLPSEERHAQREREREGEVMWRYKQRTVHHL